MMVFELAHGVGCCVILQPMSAGVLEGGGGVGGAVSCGAVWGGLTARVGAAQTTGERRLDR